MEANTETQVDAALPTLDAAPAIETPADNAAGPITSTVEDVKAELAQSKQEQMEVDEVEAPAILPSAQDVQPVAPPGHFLSPDNLSEVPELTPLDGSSSPAEYPTNEVALPGAGSLEHADHVLQNDTISGAPNPPAVESVQVVHDADTAPADPTPGLSNHTAAVADPQQTAELLAATQPDGTAAHAADQAGHMTESHAADQAGHVTESHSAPSTTPTTEAHVAPLHHEADLNPAVADLPAMAAAQQEAASTEPSTAADPASLVSANGSSSQFHVQNHTPADAQHSLLPASAVAMARAQQQTDAAPQDTAQHAPLQGTAQQQTDAAPQDTAQQPTYAAPQDTAQQPTYAAPLDTAQQPTYAAPQDTAQHDQGNAQVAQGAPSQVDPSAANPTGTVGNADPGAAANMTHVRVGRVIAGPGEMDAVQSEQQTEGPKYVTRVILSPNKPAGAPSAHATAGGHNETAGPGGEPTGVVPPPTSTAVHAAPHPGPPAEPQVQGHEAHAAAYGAALDASTSSAPGAPPVTAALPEAQWPAIPIDPQLAMAMQSAGHDPGAQGAAGQQAFVSAAECAPPLAYGQGQPVDGTAVAAAVPGPPPAVLPDGTPLTDAAGMQHMVFVSPEAMAAFPGAPVASSADAGVAPVDAQQQQEMMMMMQQQWLAANGGSAVYMQAPPGTVMSEAMVAQQHQHWLRVCNGEGVDVPMSAADAAAMAAAAAAGGVGTSAALPVAMDAAASGSEAAMKVVAGQKRPPWLDVCYNHTPPEPHGPFSPDGYVSPHPGAVPPVASAAPVAPAAPLAEPTSEANDDDPNRSARKWQKVRQGPVPRHRAVAVPVSPDAYSMPPAGGVVNGDLAAAAAGQQPQPGQVAQDAQHGVAAPPREVQQVPLQQLTVYTVDGVPVDAAGLAQAQAAGLTPQAHVVNMVPAEEMTDASAMTSPVDASGVAVAPGGATPWIAIRAATGVQPGQYVATEAGVQVQLPDGSVATMAEVGVAVCAAVGCGRRAEEQQQLCWKHLMEVKAQEGSWQQTGMLVPSGQELDNQRLEELATAALLPQDGDPGGMPLASPAATVPADAKAVAKPRAKRARRRGGALTTNNPPCAIPTCRREARSESAEGLCSFHAPKRPRGRPDAPPCAEAECRKKARLCADGQMMYCLEHLQARGLVPRAVSCGYPGCTKSSVPNMDGQRLYCTAHTRERGLRPRVVSCTLEGCGKVAQPSVDGQRLYCVSHMRQHGLTPKTGGCRHEGCTKVAKLATDGQLHYCIAHMRVNGLSPKVAVCSFEGCQKVAKASTNGQSLYCIAHMREYGLEPKVPACQNAGCPKVAKTSNDGQHVYCIAHMRERGLSPRMASCHHPSCTEFAAPATNKRCVYCKTHMPLYNLVPKEE